MSSAREIRARPLTPGTERRVNFLLEQLRSGNASLIPDAEGKPHIVYNNEQKIALTHVDRSRAHTIQEGKDSSDVQKRVAVCLEMIEAIKESSAPSGVVLDKDKVKVSRVGSYIKDEHFSQLKEILGTGNCAGDIVVVKDTVTEEEHAVKTVMISEFSTNEVKAWVDLGESESFPSLYLFYLDGNKVHFHMEKIEQGITLDEVISDHMMKLCEKKPELVRPFSLCMFQGLLTVLREMHNKNWAHCDLHGRNAMLTKDTMRLKFLDFGMARKLRTAEEFNHIALRKDILCIIRLFCNLYIGQDFKNNFCLEEHIKNETLEEVLMETSALDNEKRKELLQLISMTYQVTQNPLQAGYGDTTPVTDFIELEVRPEDIQMVLKTAAAILFPDLYSGEEDKSLHAVGDEVDSLHNLDLPAATARISDEFLEELSIKLGTKLRFQRNV